MMLENFRNGYKTGTLCWDNLLIVDGDIYYEIHLDYRYPYIKLEYIHDRRSYNSSYIDYDCKINLQRISCNFGGFRYWFICPGCFRRVVSIYFFEGRFLCRHCHSLKYISQLLTKKLRWHPDIRKIIIEKRMKKIEKHMPRSLKWKGRETKKLLRYNNLSEDLDRVKWEKEIRWNVKENRNII